MKKRGTKPKPAEDRFWKFVRKEDHGCWVWQGALFQGTGYGAFNYNGHRVLGAHRVSFFFYYKRWPTLHCLHKCGVRNCVNPKHLYEGDDVDNHLDSRRMGTYSPPPVRRGEANNKSVLTTQLVKMIRNDPRSCAKIAKSLGVSSSAIERVRNGKSWKHVK